MKNLILLGIAIIAISTTSCKKKYSCECTTTSSYGGAPDVNKSTATVYSEKMSKKQAQAACDHEETAIKSSFDNSFTENGQYPNFAVVSSSCDLK